MSAVSLFAVTWWLVTTSYKSPSSRMSFIFFPSSRSGDPLLRFYGIHLKGVDCPVRLGLPRSDNIATANVIKSVNSRSIIFQAHEFYETLGLLVKKVLLSLFLKINKLS